MCIIIVFCTGIDSLSLVRVFAAFVSAADRISRDGPQTIQEGRTVPALIRVCIFVYILTGFAAAAAAAAASIAATAN